MLTNTTNNTCMFVQAMTFITVFLTVCLSLTGKTGVYAI